MQAAFGILFVVSGALLWLGERNTALRFSGTIVLHDWLTYAATILVAGHLYLSLLAPSARPSLRGMVRGVVRASWARAPSQVGRRGLDSPAWGQVAEARRAALPSRKFSRLTSA